MFSFADAKGAGTKTTQGVDTRRSPERMKSDPYVFRTVGEGNDRWKPVRKGKTRNDAPPKQPREAPLHVEDEVPTENPSVPVAGIIIFIFGFQTIFLGHRPGT